MEFIPYFEFDLLELLLVGFEMRLLIVEVEVGLVGGGFDRLGCPLLPLLPDPVDDRGTKSQKQYLILLPLITINYNQHKHTKPHHSHISSCKYTPFHPNEEVS